MISKGIYVGMKCNICRCEVHRAKHCIERPGWSTFILQCSNCGLLFRWPVPTNVKNLYNEGYYKGTNRYSYIDEREDKFLRDIENKRRIDNLKTFFPKDKKLSLLDIGCSFGALVDIALLNSIAGEGIDISDYVKYQSKSNRLRQGDVCEGINGKYSIITMVEVIEHLTDPNKALNNCYNALESDGVILIQTTNMDSLVRKFEGKNSRYFLPGHIYYFSLKTLVRMLKKHNFKIEKIYFGHETGLIPALIRKSITNIGRLNLSDWLVALYTFVVHLCSKIHIGNITIHNGMVIIARK